MNVKLEVVRGRDGILRDTYHRPMVVVFDSRQSHLTPLSAAARSCKPAARIPWQPNDKRDNSQLLTFVNVSGPAENVNTHRKKIKTHVMRDYRRRERQQKQVVQQPSATRQVSNPFRSSSHESNHLAWKSMPPRQPCGGLDPFAKCPIQMQPHMSRLCHYYISVVENAPCYQKELGWESDPAIPGLFSLAMTDATLFYMVLCSSVVYGNLMNGKSESLDRITYVIKSIQLINASLTSPVNEISDAIIAAVALLAIAECCAGDYMAWTLHMRGLSQMVQVRGGITMLGVLVQREVYMADFFGCMETDSLPRYELYHNAGPSSHPAMVESTILELCEGFHRISIVISLNIELVLILCKLQQLADAIVQAKSNSAYIIHSIASLRYRLLSYNRAKMTSNRSDVIAEACRLGALIFMKTIFQSPFCGFNHPSAFTHKRFIEKLRMTLDRTELSIDVCETPFAEFVLWLVVIGGIASEVENRAWFVARLSKIAVILRLSTWEDVKLVLTRFVWIEGIHEVVCSDLWDNLVCMNERHFLR